MASNFIFSIILGTSLQSLWGAINVLQIVLFMGMIQIRQSSNIRQFYTVLSGLLNIDIISSESLGLTFVDYSEFQAENKDMYELGFQSNIQIKNDLTIVLVYLFSIFGMGVALSSGNKRLIKMFVYGSFIRIALESSIEVIMLGLQEFYYFPGF